MKKKDLACPEMGKDLIDKAQGACLFEKEGYYFLSGMSALDKYKKTGRGQPERDFNAHALRLESVGLFLFLDCLSATAPFIMKYYIILITLQVLRQLLMELQQTSYMTLLAQSMT